VLLREITGNKIIKEALIQSVKKNHIAHAQLFWGLEGSANLAMALAYSRLVLCEDLQADDACGQCTSCKLMNKLNHPDLHLYMPLTTFEGKKGEELKAHHLPTFKKTILENPYIDINDWSVASDAENKQPIINVEEGRNMVQQASMKSFNGGYKIFLIWLPELMHNSTANAILKMLEEPPKQTLFLLVTQNMEKLLQTIISRCQILKLPLFEDDDIFEYLITHRQAEENKAREIARLANGSMRKAIFLLNHTEGNHFERYTQWLRLCYAKKYKELIIWTDDTAALGRENIKNMLSYGIDIFHHILMYKSGNEALVKLVKKEYEFVENFSKFIEIHKIEPLITLLNDAHNHIEKNGNPKIVLFDTSLKLSANIR
jgi:DNA polymerase-3 subunit delta'